MTQPGQWQIETDQRKRRGHEHRTFHAKARGTLSTVLIFSGSLTLKLTLRDPKKSIKYLV